MLLHGVLDPANTALAFLHTDLFHGAERYALLLLALLPTCEVALMRELPQLVSKQLCALVDVLALQEVFRVRPGLGGVPQQLIDTLAGSSNVLSH